MRFARIFTFGELWTSGDEWSCEAVPGCTKTSDAIGLTAKEVSRINAVLPGNLVDGVAYGPEVAAFILKNNLGKVVCENHQAA